MKKTYISPIIGVEVILDDEIIATSGEPQCEDGDATTTGGPDGASYHSLSKDFSDFSFDDDFDF